MLMRERVKKPSLGDIMYKHSPLKRGLIKVKDEDDVYRNVDKIINRIYLGNNRAAKDRVFFKEKNIKAVLNCSKDIPSKFKSDPSIEYMRIPIHDSLKEVDIEKAFLFMPAAIEFIHKHVAIEKKNILVHCWAGRQRSAIMVVAYLVTKHGMTPEEASKLLIKKRPEVFHFGKSYNFERSIVKYYKKLQREIRL